MNKQLGQIIFPKYAFQGYLYSDTENLKVFYPFRYLYSELQDIKKACMEIVSSVSSYPISPVAIVFPVELEKTFLFTPTYSLNPVVSFSDMDRTRSFIEPLRMPKLYQMLVVPNQVNKLAVLETAACFRSSTDLKNIESFLASSVLSLQIDSKSAALYNFKKPFSWDLESDARGIVRTVGSPLLN